MTIIQLKYVLAVATYQNFTKAASKLFMTQPTLSMQIQKLEEELEILIFDRSKKPIVPTDIGKKLIAQAQNIVDESERLHDIIQQQKGYVGGEFKLGIIPTVMPTLLPVFLNVLTKKYRELSLKIKELATDSVIEKLENRQLDAAIAVTPLENNNFKEKVLYYEPFVGYIPTSHRLYAKKRINPNDLKLEDMLILEDGHCFRNGVINLCKATRSVGQNRFELSSGSFETLVRLVDEGLGMTLIPYLHAQALATSKANQIRYFEEPTPVRAVSLIYHKNETKSQINKAIYSCILGVVRGMIKLEQMQLISPLQSKKNNPKVVFL